MGDAVIKVNLVNFITIGLMGFIFYSGVKMILNFVSARKTTDE